MSITDPTRGSSPGSPQRPLLRSVSELFSEQTVKSESSHYQLAKLDVEGGPGQSS